MKSKKREPWRVIVFIIAVAFIVFMWVKDIVTIYTTMPREQVIPLIVTTLAVSLLKVGIMAGVILSIKWIIGKVKKRK